MYYNGLCLICGQISDAVYGLVQSQAQAQYEAVVQSCEAGRPPLETTIRTDMDQIITSKEHVTSKIRGSFNWWFIPLFIFIKWHT